MLKKFSIAIILTILVTCFYLYKNQEIFFIHKAKSCIKNSNTACAQKYIEKTFDLNVNNEELRDAYVDILITSPLTIDVQEKILKFFSYNIEDSAKLKLDYYLHDLRLEIFRKYNGNYIKNAVYNNKILHWGSLPITYSINRTIEVPVYFVTAIESAFKTWEDALDGEIKFQKTTGNANIAINFERKNNSKAERKYIVAHTTPNIIGDKLEEMEIKFYLTNPSGKYFSKNQIYNTALHEISHALGFMGHSNVQSDVMYMLKEEASNLNDSISLLTDSDLFTIKLLYKIKPDFTNASELTWEYLPKIVLGSSEDVLEAKKEEAKEYIRTNPTVASGYIDLADVYFSTKNYSDAILLLEQALNKISDEDMLDMVYYNIAICYYFIDNYEVAKDYLFKSISMNKTEEKMFLLAEIYNKSGYFDFAEKEYKNLIKKRPKNSDYNIAIINFYVKNKQYLRARQHLRKYFRLCPEEKNNEKFKSYGILMLLL